MNSFRADFENSAKLLPLSVSHSARKIVWPFRSTRNSIRIAATLCIPRNRGRPGQLRPNRTFSAPSVCLLIDFQRPVPRVPRLLNSTRVVAGPITFQLGADAVLGQTTPLPTEEITRHHLPVGVGLWDHRQLVLGDRPRVLCSRLQKGAHPMPHKKERNLAFGPTALNDLAQAFDTAWLELRAWGIEANTELQIKCIKTKLAQRII